MVWKVFVTGGFNESQKHAGPTGSPASHQQRRFSRVYFSFKACPNEGLYQNSRRKDCGQCREPWWSQEPRCTHHAGPTNVHAMPPNTHEEGSMGFIWRCFNFHRLKWYMVINCLPSHYCQKPALRPQDITGRNWNWSKYKGTTFVTVWNQAITKHQREGCKNSEQQRIWTWLILSYVGLCFHPYTYALSYDNKTVCRGKVCVCLQENRYTWGFFFLDRTIS